LIAETAPNFPYFFHVSVQWYHILWENSLQNYWNSEVAAWFSSFSLFCLFVRDISFYLQFSYLSYTGRLNSSWGQVHTVHAEGCKNHQRDREGKGERAWDSLLHSQWWFRLCAVLPGWLLSKFHLLLISFCFNVYLL
jgi:hypothetical protein